MITRSLIFYIGCALIPTPPSPCPDFGFQFLFAIAIGLFSPKIAIEPIYRFFHWTGSQIKKYLKIVPLLGTFILKVDSLLKRWFRFMNKERESDNVVIDKLYDIFLTDDLIERLVFGYFISIVLGVCLMAAALYL